MCCKEGGMMSPTYPDYSEWLGGGERVSKEETAWRGSQLHMNYAAHVALVRTKFKIFKILELGCGTGWVPTRFDTDIHYVGIDKNPAVLHIAREKNNPNRLFVQADLRNAAYIKQNWTPVDLVCSFAVLKHFSLDEFDSIFSGMLSLANIGLFSMNIANEVRDDGAEFHHIWVTNEWLKSILDRNGFELLYKTLVWQGKTWEERTGEEAIFAVVRKP